LTLFPHIPPTITKLEQRFPIRLGSKKIYLSTSGVGRVTGVKINGKTWTQFDGVSVRLPADGLPEEAVIQIALRGAQNGPAPAVTTRNARIDVHHPLTKKVHRFHANLVKAGLSNCYEAAHAQLILEMAGALAERRETLMSGKLEKLSDATQNASDEAYEDAIRWLVEGLEGYIRTCEDPRVSSAWE
jgi:hypothetical protein